MPSNHEYVYFVCACNILYDSFISLCTSLIGLAFSFVLQKSDVKSRLASNVCKILKTGSFGSPSNLKASSGHLVCVRFRLLFFVSSSASLCSFNVSMVCVQHIRLVGSRAHWLGACITLILFLVGRALLLSHSSGMPLLSIVSSSLTPSLSFFFLPSFSSFSDCVHALLSLWLEALPYAGSPVLY